METPSLSAVDTGSSISSAASGNEKEPTTAQTTTTDLSVNLISEEKDDDVEYSATMTERPGLGDDSQETEGQGTSSAPIPNNKQTEAPGDIEENANSSSDESSGSSSSGSSYFTRRAARENTTTLYKAYSRRLRSSEVGPETHKKKAPKLVRSFIDYLQVLEDRVQKLETTGTSAAPDSDGKDKATAGPEGDKATEDDEAKRLNVETKFYRQDIKESNQMFESDVSPQPLLKVAYEPLVNARPLQASADDFLAQPDTITVNKLILESQPILKFLEAHVGFKVPKTRIQISRPFRLLLRNADKFKGQLEKLEGKHQ